MIRKFVLISLIGTAALAASDDVKIETGRLKGVAHDGVVAFKGVPFAEPPVGDLRWRPPQPAKAWTGVRQASEYGADCAQKPFPGDAAPLGVQPAEDCLYANVWIPESRIAREGLLRTIGAVLGSLP